MAEDEDSEAAEGEDEEEEGPDLLLREAARIVADMFELGSDMELLERQFVQLSEKTHEDS
jgi:hypothetical protein